MREADVQFEVRPAAPASPPSRADSRKRARCDEQACGAEGAAPVPDCADGTERTAKRLKLTTGTIECIKSAIASFRRNIAAGGASAGHLAPCLATAHADVCGSETPRDVL